MRDVAVVGIGMTQFGKLAERSGKDLVREAVEAALTDAGVARSELQAAYVGNSMAGLLWGQESIRGQVVLSAMGIDTIPIFNVENACASSSTAFHLAWLGVASGQYDRVLAVGYEKLYHPDKQRSFQALASAIDVENGSTFLRDFAARQGVTDVEFPEGGGRDRSIFMDMYSLWVRPYMKRYGLTQEHFARLSVKSHRNAAKNPRAQYRKEVTLEEVLGSGEIVFPLTRMMCAPIGDGAAAAILCSKEQAARLTTSPVWVAASAVASGSLGSEGEAVAERLAPRAYDQAGIGPADIDVIEVHDAAAPSEIMALIQVGLCPGEEAGRWIEEGRLDLGGALPTNPSGGLQSKGHPVGATGLGQIHEIVSQLRGTSGERQVSGCRVGMTQNGGGILGADAAAMCLHIFNR
ncbi:MAG: thiolase family protein [Deltaproteobacteria bacterium]|nr:thiolase family protein [Deltaproteobacteria bacterium]